MSSVTFLSDRPRTKEVVLEWPVKFGDREYRSIWLARLTAADVAKFQKELTELLAKDENATATFPIYRDENGEAIPQEVLDGIDDADRYALEVASLDFLPRRFRSVEKADSPPGNGENTGPTSGA